MPYSSPAHTGTWGASACTFSSIGGQPKIQVLLEMVKSKCFLNREKQIPWIRHSQREFESLFERRSCVFSLHPSSTYQFSITMEVTGTFGHPSSAPHPEQYSASRKLAGSLLPALLRGLFSWLSSWLAASSLFLPLLFPS